MDKSRKPSALVKQRPRKKLVVPSPCPRASAPAAAVDFGVECSAEPRYTTLLTADHPLLLCAINCGYAAVGLAVLLVARRVSHLAVCAHFVVDLLACGVTEVYGEVFDTEGLADYVVDMDGRVPLESCDERHASAILKVGMARGLANHIPQPEALEQWVHILPDDSLGGAEAEALVFGDLGRPLAIGEMLASLHQREARAALRALAEPCCVVRAPSRVEH